MPIEPIQSSACAGAAGAAAADLVSFLAKIDGGGDLASACQALLAKDGEAQFRSGRLGVAVQKRQLAEARQRRFEALQKHWRAAKKSGFWSRLAKTLGAVFAAATAALGVMGCPVGAVSLAGAAAAGGAKIAGARQGLKAAGAQANMARQEVLIDFHRSELKTFGEFLEQAARFEADMARQVLRVCERQYGARPW